MSMRMLLIPLGLALVIGCNKEPGAGGTGGGTGTAPKTASGPEMTPKKDLGPVETYDALRDGIAANKPEVVWDLLPASYQKDVQDVVREFAGKMDAELWNKSAGLLKKAVQVLQTKKDFILNHEMVASKLPNKDEVDKSWDGVAKMLSTVVNSDLTDLNKLKSVDVRAIVAQVGGDVMAQAQVLSAMSPNDEFKANMDKMKSTKITLVKEDGNTAVVKVESEGEEPKEKEMVKVEGKWIPKDMADDWKEGIAKAKEKIAEIDAEQISAAKQQVMPMFGAVEGILDKALAARTQDEFNQVIGEAMGIAMMMSMGSGGAPPGGAPPDGVPPVPNP